MAHKIGRVTIEGTDHVKVYHSRLLLGPKSLPVMAEQVAEVVNLAFMLRKEQLENSGHAIPASHPLAALFGGTDARAEDTESHSVVKLVKDMDGVAHVFAIGYQLIVVKGKMFEWEEIEPKLVKLLASFASALPSEEEIMAVWQTIKGEK